MSESAYQKLTPEQQAIFKEAGAEATKYSVEVGIKADSEIVDFLKAQGMQVNDAYVGAFVEASQSIWTDWAGGARCGCECTHRHDLESRRLGVCRIRDSAKVRGKDSLL